MGTPFQIMRASAISGHVSVGRGVVDIGRERGHGNVDACKSVATAAKVIEMPAFRQRFHGYRAARVAG
jgi:hypothetical protein